MDFTPPTLPHSKCFEILIERTHGTTPMEETFTTGGSSLTQLLSSILSSAAAQIPASSFLRLINLLETEH